MTDTEKKALALVTQLQEEDDGKKYSYAYHFEALCRAIEQHEAFRQEVSDAVEADIAKQIAHGIEPKFRTNSVRFIIAKTDPLVEVINDADDMVRKPDAPSYAEAIRAALAARGLEVRKIGEGE